MSLEKDLETRVEEVLQADSVKKAEQLIKSRSGVTILAAISFIESSLPLPILTDPFLIAAILVNRAQTARLVFVTTIASVLGGVFAYFMAVFFLETLQQWMTVGMLEQFQSLTDTNQSGAFILTLVGAVTPVPYTIVAWVMGVMQGGILVFIIASLLGRGGRYAVVGYCTYKFGPLAVSYIKRYVGILSVVILVLVGLFIWYKM